MFVLGERTSRYLRISLWILVGLEFVSSLLVLAFSATLSPKFVDIGLATAPSKIKYNIVCAVFTFLAFLAAVPLIYFKPQFWSNYIERYSPWPALVAHILATIFWIASAGSAFLTCSDFCAVERDTQPVFIHWCTQCCTCPDAQSQPCGDGTGESEGFTRNLGNAYIGSIYQLNQAFCVLQMLFFMATATILLVRFFGNRDQARSNPLQGASKWFAQNQNADDAKEPMRHTPEQQQQQFAGPPYQSYEQQQATSQQYQGYEHQQFAAQPYQSYEQDDYSNGVPMAERSGV